MTNENLDVRVALVDVEKDAESLGSIVQVEAINIVATTETSSPPSKRRRRKSPVRSKTIIPVDNPSNKSPDLPLTKRRQPKNNEK